MTSATAIIRYVVGILFPITFASCSGPHDRTLVPSVDLVRSFERAEKRPLAGFSLSTYEVGRIDRAVIAAPVPSRAIWSTALPHRGVFRAFVAAAHASSGVPAGPVRVRVGISDDRIYEGLAEAVVSPGEPRWTEIQADLSAYAGWQWSVFYHPDRITWRIVLAADPVAARPATVMWGTPQIVTDNKSALEYARRAD